MKNATDWLNEYGMCEHFGTISKYAPDAMSSLGRKMGKIDELWVKARNGETRLIDETKRLILEWFIHWRILIDSVRGLKE
jgi:hypothetical protein